MQSAGFSADDDERHPSPKPLIMTWIAVFPLTLVMLLFLWSSVGGEPISTTTMVMYALFVPMGIALAMTVYLALKGVAQASREGTGWRNLPPLYQGCIVFSLSLAVALVIFPISFTFELMPLGPGEGQRFGVITATLIYFAIGLESGFITLGVVFPGLLPLIIMFIIVHKKHGLSRQGIINLTVLSTFCWLITGTIGGILLQV